VPIDLQKIEQLRRKAGLTQGEIAFRVGLTKQRWNNIVNGRCANISIKTLDRIAGALGIDPAELLIRPIPPR
jgi:transcriptional regulator with XRE-family HTH domain